MSLLAPRRGIVLLVLASLGLAGVALAANEKSEKVVVKMARMQFVPEEVTIKAGQTVQWLNNDDRDYLIVADDGSFKSDNLRPKGTFEHTFKEAGKFGYKNMLRPRSTGTITVTE